MRITRSRWFTPLFALGLGVVLLVAQWIGGSPRSGLWSLAIMAGFGALLLFGGRSETIRGLRGDGRDERFRQIDIRDSPRGDRRAQRHHHRLRRRARPRARRLAVRLARRDRRPHLPGRDHRLPATRLAHPSLAYESGALSDVGHRPERAPRKAPIPASCLVFMRVFGSRLRTESSGTKRHRAARLPLDLPSPSAPRIPVPYMSRRG